MWPHTHEGAGGGSPFIGLARSNMWVVEAAGAGTSLNKGKGWIKEEEACGSRSLPTMGWVGGSLDLTEILGKTRYLILPPTHSD